MFVYMLRLQMAFVWGKRGHVPQNLGGPVSRSTCRTSKYMHPISNNCQLSRTVGQIIIFDRVGLFHAVVLVISKNIAISHILPKHLCAFHCRQYWSNFSYFDVDEIGCKLVLFIDRKSHMGFRLVLESVTLNDL